MYTWVPWPRSLETWRLWSWQYKLFEPSVVSADYCTWVCSGATWAPNHWTIFCTVSRDIFYVDCSLGELGRNSFLCGHFKPYLQAYVNSHSIPDMAEMFVSAINGLPGIKVDGMKFLISQVSKSRHINETDVIFNNNCVQRDR